MATATQRSTVRAMIPARGVWYIESIPSHVVAETAGGRVVMFRLQPFRWVTEDEFEPYHGPHPSEVGVPVPWYIWRYYGLEEIR